jgi:hypothetical protein
VTKQWIKTNKCNEWWSHDNCEDVVVTIESTLAIGADVEDLRELELVVFVHNQTSWYKNQETSLNWAWLYVLVVNAVDNLLESKWFNFLWNFFDAIECLTSIRHNAVVIVEVDKLSSVLHDGRVVLSQEFLWDVFVFGHCKLPPKLYKNLK